MVIAPPVAKTPLEKMCEAFPHAKQRRNGWWANDDNPRFDFLERPDGTIAVHSHTGRTVEDILSMGATRITRADLSAGKRWSKVQSRDALDLLSLAEYMLLDWRFLFNLGYSDGYSYTDRDGRVTTCVKVGGYTNKAGQEHSKIKVRLHLAKEPRFLWDQGTPGEVIPCGLGRLDMAREAGYLVIGEGESDAATMWFHGLPFLGIPGASHIKCLDVGLLDGIEAVYVLEEPDQVAKLSRQGQGFYKDMRAHLRAGGYTGAIYSLRLFESFGVKDPSDLHKSIYRTCEEKAEGPFRAVVHAQFVAAIEQAIRLSIPEGNYDFLPARKSPADVAFEEWTIAVLAVNPDIVSPIRKLILIYLFPYVRDREASKKGWKFETRDIAHALCLPEKSLLAHLAFLTNKVGLFSKDYLTPTEYSGDEDDLERRYKGKELFIRPTLGYYQPRGYCALVQHQRQQGGPRLPECEYCGSKNVKPYGRICLDCGHVTYPPIEPDEIEEEAPTAAEPVEEQPFIETTATVRPLEIEAEEEHNPDTPNLGVSGIDSSRAPQLGGVGTSEPVAPYDGPYPPPKRLTLCCDAGWRWDREAQQFDLRGQYVCAACHPPPVQVLKKPKRYTPPVLLAAVLP